MQIDDLKTSLKLSIVPVIHMSDFQIHTLQSEYVRSYTLRISNVPVTHEHSIINPPTCVLPCYRTRGHSEVRTSEIMRFAVRYRGHYRNYWCV